jgi:hypothetical protein
MLALVHSSQTAFRSTFGTGRGGCIQMLSIVVRNFKIKNVPLHTGNKDIFCNLICITSEQVDVLVTYQHIFEATFYVMCIGHTVVFRLKAWHTAQGFAHRSRKALWKMGVRRLANSH